MKKLDKNLIKWVEKGFLSPGQREKIKEFEENESKTKGSNRVLYGLGLVSV